MIANIMRGFALVTVAVLAACATPVHHNTPSGKIEVMFAGFAPAVVKPAIAAQMINRGYNITRDTEYLMVFDKPITNGMAAALLGSRYDGTPNARVSVTMLYADGDTRVIGDLAVITNPGSAFERRMDVNNSKDSLVIWEAISAARTSLGRPTTLTILPAAKQVVKAPLPKTYSNWSDN